MFIILKILTLGAAKFKTSLLEVFEQPLYLVLPFHRYVRIFRTRLLWILTLILRLILRPTFTLDLYWSPHEHLERKS